MYKVVYLDYANREVSMSYINRDLAEQYARRINDVMNKQVSVIKMSEELVLSLLPRENVGKSIS